MAMTRRSTNLARMITTGAWSVAFALMILGLIEDQDPGDFYAFSVFVSIAACVPSWWLITEHLVAREQRETADTIADAVGKAMAERMEAERALTLLRR